MWWKIYFWILFILTILGLIGTAQYSPLPFADILSIIATILVLIATYSYVFKKPTFSANIWDIIFVILIILTFLDFISAFVYPQLYDAVLPFLKSKISMTSTDVVIGALLVLPGIYANYQISNFGKKKKKK